MSIKEIEVKKALNRSYFADYMLANMYSLSPYMGCSHDCIYCDGRAERYHLTGEFSRDITVRTNLPDLLQAEMPKLRESAPIHLASGISDVYQSIEKKYELTKRCSEIFAQYNHHVSVLTKSSLVLRDFDNWIEVNRRGGFTLQVSLTTLDDNIREKIEPGASSVEERLEIIQAFKSAGCRVGVYMMPLLPGITYNLKDVERTKEKLVEMKVDYITPWYVTLRPGRQKEYFLQSVEKSFPKSLPIYNDIYRENRVSGGASKDFENIFFQNMDTVFKNVNQLPPHSYYRGIMPIYCEVIILLQHMIYLYSRKGVDVSGLEQGYKSFRTFFENEKKRFNRKKTLPPDELDNTLIFLAKTEGLRDIIKNERLLNFITEVVTKRRIFNYHSLKLI